MRAAAGVFGLLLLLLLLTWHYESGSSWGVCKVWGGLLTGGPANAMASMHMRPTGVFGFRGVVLLLLVFLFLYLLFSGRSRGPSAIDDLNARFARGEVSREEYEEAKKLIEES